MEAQSMDVSVSSGDQSEFKLNYVNEASNEECTKSSNVALFTSSGVSKFEVLSEQVANISNNSSKNIERTDASPVVVQSEGYVRQTELLVVPSICIPAAGCESSHPAPPASQDPSSADGIVGESDSSKDSSGIHDKRETSKNLFGDSSIDASESLAGNYEDRKPAPTIVNDTNAAVMIIDVNDDSDTSTVLPQESYMDFKSTPFQITGVWREFDHATENNFTKGCKWSPDGTCILSCNEDAKMRLFNLPVELYQTPINWASVSEMVSVLQVSEAELIYDYCWYPLMSSLDPVSCCFVSSSRCNPVHMWDAFTGELRCTYRSYNHVDEIVAAHGLAFDSDGQKLYCGFKNMIRIFNVSIPGRTFKELPTCVKKCGQKGIISCFAFSAENRNIFAAGSYNKTVGIYSETDGSLMHLLGQRKGGGGVTHMCFSPDGYQLYCGGRKDPEIQCWDMRNLKKPLFQLRRICNTNQRLYFDISRCGHYVASGNNNGVVTVWDVKQPSKEICVGESMILEPLQFYQAHHDCVNGISFHPNLPLLATSSGQRQFPEILDSEGEESDGVMFTDKHIVKDNSIRLWWTGSSAEH